MRVALALALASVAVVLAVVTWKGGENAVELAQWKMTGHIIPSSVKYVYPVTVQKGKEVKVLTTCGARLFVPCLSKPQTAQHKNTVSKMYKMLKKMRKSASQRRQREKRFRRQDRRRLRKFEGRLSKRYDRLQKDFKKRIAGIKKSLKEQAKACTSCKAKAKPKAVAPKKKAAPARKRRVRNIRRRSHSAVFPATRQGVVMAAPFKGFPSKAVTVAFWVYSTDTQPSGLVSYATENNDNAFLLWNPQDMYLYIQGQALRTGVNVADGKWHHLAVAWTAATGRVSLFKDGMPALNAVFAQDANIAPTGALCLGQEQDTVGGGFNIQQAFVGRISDFAVWSIPLHMGQVRRAMKAGPKTVKKSSLVVDWMFTRKSKAVDKSGHSRSGLIEGGVTRKRMKVSMPPPWK